ncbi:sorting nexin-9-like, partial [Plectropomus leopardus]|uniref:sorting nexin-9-like n=1 Tax=Plectropomus leopardus TaxID=160734 RepID=UPI001C4D58D7
DIKADRKQTESCDRGPQLTTETSRSTGSPPHVSLTVPRINTRFLTRTLCVSQAEVLYDFTAVPGNNELTVRQGETVSVLDQTVGGGWIKAQNSSGQTGLVPEGYLQVRGGGVGGGADGDSWSGTEAFVNNTADGHQSRGLTHTQQAAVEDDDGEWDDDWDDQSMGSYRGDDPLDLEGGASGRSLHGTSMKISLNKFPFSKGPSPEVFLLAKPPANSRDQLPVYMGEVGPVWLYPTAPLDCVIADPKKESKLYGLKSFIEYQLTPNVRVHTNTAVH